MVEYTGPCLDCGGPIDDHEIHLTARYCTKCRLKRQRGSIYSIRDAVIPRCRDITLKAIEEQGWKTFINPRLDVWEPYEADFRAAGCRTRKAAITGIKMALPEFGYYRHSNRAFALREVSQGSECVAEEVTAGA